YLVQNAVIGEARGKAMGVSGIAAQVVKRIQIVNGDPFLCCRGDETIHAPASLLFEKSEERLCPGACQPCKAVASRICSRRSSHQAYPLGIRRRNDSLPSALAA